MKFLKMKKSVALAASVVVVAIAAVGAYAYFTSTGSGTGSATVGTSTAWEVDQLVSPAPTGDPLYPNAAIGTGNIQTNAYHVKNNSTGVQSLAQVDISVKNSDASVWTKCAGVATTDGSNVTLGDCDDGTYIGKPACTASDFSVGGVAVGGTKTDVLLAGSFAAGQDKITGTVTVQMINNTLNQDNCKSASVPLYFSAS